MRDSEKRTHWMTSFDQLDVQSACDIPLTNLSSSVVGRCFLTAAVLEDSGIQNDEHSRFAYPGLTINCTMQKEAEIFSAGQRFSDM